MAATLISSNDGDHFEDAFTEKDKSMSPQIKNLILSLPREMAWNNKFHICLFQNFWCVSSLLQPIISFQQHFQAKGNDIIVATLPKSGTTWVKALAFAIAKRHRFDPSLHNHNHPLLHSNPHTLVPFFEMNLYVSSSCDQNISNFSEPRIFGTHIPFPSLPPLIKSSNCKIIYLCRNPFDNFVSLWHFLLKRITATPLTLEEAFEKYSRGVILFGPFWSHTLGYWNESKDKPNKIMFLKYEDLKEDTKLHVKRMAEFLDCPFSSEEESNGVIEDVIRLCSFEKMKELEVNKSEKFLELVENKYFFRKGEIGDWVNYLSPKMVEKLSNVIQEKLGGSGLSFKFIP